MRTQKGKVLRNVLTTALFLFFGINTIAQITWTFDCDLEGWKGMRYCPATHIMNHENGALLYRACTGSLLISPEIDVEISPRTQLVIAVEYQGKPKPQELNGAIQRRSDGARIPFSWNSNEQIVRVNISELGEKQDQFQLSFYPTQSQEEPLLSIDWIAITEDENFIPQQQTECAPQKPIIQNLHAVIFGNRASISADFVAGGFASATVNYWDKKEPKLKKTIGKQVTSTYGIYFNMVDLDVDTEYAFQITLSNSKGKITSKTQYFTTESKNAEEMPMKLWMTPTPLKVDQDVNIDLLDNNQWEEAASLVDVYKVHGFSFYSVGITSELNVARLIYKANKHRMRLAHEGVIDGNADADVYVNNISVFVEKYAQEGGKLEFFTWDGMLFRSFYKTVGVEGIGEMFRSVDEGITVLAQTTKKIKEKYPHLEIIPLSNLPNWNVKGIPHNATNFSNYVGGYDWDDLCDIYFEKLKELNIQCKYIEIDHPFNYYMKDYEMCKKRLRTFNVYCKKNNIGCEDDLDKCFYDGVIDFLIQLEEDGIEFNYYDIESWYTFPLYFTPEDNEHSFTNVLLDAGKILKK